MSAARRVYAAFFCYALALGGIFPRLGDLQQALALDERTLGLSTIGIACGTLISLTLAGRWLERWGHRTVLLVLVPLMAACFAAASGAGSAPTLFVLLVPAGLCVGAVEIVVNLEADRVEHQLGRRIMSRAHAFWSIGFFTAGLAGAALAQLGLSPQAHLAVMGVVVAGLCALLLRGLQAAAHRPQHAAPAAAGHTTHAVAGVQTRAPAPACAETVETAATALMAVMPAPHAPRWARPTRVTLVLVAATLAAMMMEGAGAEWSAIYMRDVFGAAPFLAGAAVATGALAQALARLVADRFVERYQPVRVARCLLLVLGAGALLVLGAPNAAAALAGFALMGVGTSALFPLAMSAAAQATDRPAAVNVAALAQTSFIVFLVGPPLLGFVATAWGIRWSFGLGLPLVVLGWWAARALAVAGGRRPPP